MTQEEATAIAQKNFKKLSPEHQKNAIRWFWRRLELGMPLTEVDIRDFGATQDKDCSGAWNEAARYVGCSFYLLEVLRLGTFDEVNATATEMYRRSRQYRFHLEDPDSISPPCS